MNFRRYRITVGGALFGATLAVTGGAAFLTANNLLFLIFAAMLALLLVSGFLNRLVLSGLELELLLPEHVCARAASPARIRLRNLKHFTASFSIELSGFGGEAAVLKPLYFPLVPGGSTVEAPIELTFARRGKHRESLFVLTSRFPFGFIQRATVVALIRETLVYPAMQPTSRVEELLQGAEQEGEAKLHAAGIDFYRIRPYVSSDSARSVDWKSTAHTGELQVREFARDESKNAEIYFDRFALPEDLAAFESAVEECAFLTWSLYERDFDLVFRSQDCELDEVFAILRFLAVAQPAAAPGAPREGEIAIGPVSQRTQPPRW